MRNNWLLVVIILTLASCNNNDVFFAYKPIANNGWSKDSVTTFDIDITDIKCTYNVYVNIRSRGEYPYQNVWLFLQKTTPDLQNSKDTIECYLADKRGKWLGSGVGSVYEMPVLYQQNVRFSKVGKYHYSIVHGMRDSVLIGMNDIGMRVEKSN